jgi:hypothetical protein
LFLVGCHLETGLRWGFFSAGLLCGNSLLGGLSAVFDDLLPALDRLLGALCDGVAPLAGHVLGGILYLIVSVFRGRL